MSLDLIWVRIIILPCIFSFCVSLSFFFIIVKKIILFLVCFFVNLAQMIFYTFFLHCFTFLCYFNLSCQNGYQFCRKSHAYWRCNHLPFSDLEPEAVVLFSLFFCNECMNFVYNSINPLSHLCQLIFFSLYFLFIQPIVIVWVNILLMLTPIMDVNTKKLKSLFTWPTSKDGDTVLRHLVMSSCLLILWLSL